MLDRKAKPFSSCLLPFRSLFITFLQIPLYLIAAITHKTTKRPCNIFFPLVLITERSTRFRSPRVEHASYVTSWNGKNHVSHTFEAYYKEWPIIVIFLLQLVTREEMIQRRITDPLLPRYVCMLKYYCPRAIISTVKSPFYSHFRDYRNKIATEKILTWPIDIRFCEPSYYTEHTKSPPRSGHHSCLNPDKPIILCTTLGHISFRHSLPPKLNIYVFTHRKKN